jgi:hypothetical protein
VVKSKDWVQKEKSVRKEKRLKDRLQNFKNML